MEKETSIQNQISQKGDIFLEHLNQNNGPLKNQDFVKGNLDTFDKYFNEEESITNSKKPINLSIEYSPLSYKNNCKIFDRKVINGGKNKIFPFNMNINDIISDKTDDITHMKKQLFNTHQNFESVDDLKKKKLILNRESAKRSRLKKKKYIENLEKEFLFLKEELLRLKSLQNSNYKSNREIINNNFSNNNIYKSVIQDNTIRPNIGINLNLNIENNQKDKEILNLKKDELNIISNNLENDSKTINNYINKQKKMLQNLLIKQIGIITPDKIKNFQNKFLKLEDIKNDDSISTIKNKINNNLETIIELYDIDIKTLNQINSCKNISKGINIYNFYNDLKSYVEQYEIIFKKLENLV